MTEDSTYKATITYKEMRWVWDKKIMTFEATSEEEAKEIIKKFFRRCRNKASIVKISFEADELKEVTE